MRALTIKQPWASLIVAGVKDVENRTWEPPRTLPQWSRCPLASCGHTRAMLPDSYTHGGTPVCVDHMAPCEMVPDGPYPFRLWVHAGRTWAPEWRQWMDVEDPRLHDLQAAGAELDEDVNGSGYWRVWPPSLPTGYLLGSVLVTGCHDSEDCWELRGAGEVVGPAPDGWHCSPWAEPDAYHWTLTDPQSLPKPIPMRGKQRLWTLPHDVEVPA